MQRSWLALGFMVFVPGVVIAQGAPQPEELPRRLQILEEQVRALQAEIAALKAAQPVPAPPVAPPAIAGQPTASPTPARAGQGSGKLLNPDIGVIGNFVGAGGDSAGGTGTIAPFRSATLQESEASFQAAIDPFARADFFLAIGEESIEVEEGYITFPALPGGFQLRAGKMRADFGRLNSFHNHTLPWVDRPIVMFNLLGGSTADPDTGIKDAGVAISHIIPAGKVFMEATGEVFRGDSGALFQSSDRSNVSLVGHLRTYADFTDRSNFEAGLSYARGHNFAGPEFLTQLYGADLTYRWKPHVRERSFTARTELIWSRRDDPVAQQVAFGWYASADFQFRHRWFVGGRYDWSERADNVEFHDRGASAVLTFWPSEFSQIRGQYRRNLYAGGQLANELLLQILFTIGAHGAHPF